MNLRVPYLINPLLSCCFNIVLQCSLSLLLRYGVSNDQIFDSNFVNFCETQVFYAVLRHSLDENVNLYNHNYNYDCIIVITFIIKHKIFRDQITIVLSPHFSHFTYVKGKFAVAMPTRKFRLDANQELVPWHRVVHRTFIIVYPTGPSA